MVFIRLETIKFFIDLNLLLILEEEKIEIIYIKISKNIKILIFLDKKYKTNFKSEELRNRKDINKKFLIL